jgi:hypothetical protein
MSFYHSFFFYFLLLLHLVDAVAIAIAIVSDHSSLVLQAASDDENQPIDCVHR